MQLFGMFIDIYEYTWQLEIMKPNMAEIYTSYSLEQ